MKKELLKKLLTAFGPSGREKKVREVIIDMIKEKADGYEVDKVGNLIAWRKGKGEKKRKILLDAHMDQIGLVVTHVDEKGFLRVEPVGGVLPQVLYASRVNFDGVIGVVGIEKESLTAFKENLRNMSFDKLFVDLAGKNIKIGTFGVYDSEPIFVENRVVSPALDDRIGCAILVETFLNSDELYNDLYVLFSVQEEHSLMGAAVGAFNVDADLAIAVDVTDSGDFPKAPKRVSMVMGKGPAIKIMDSMSVSNQRVVELMKRTAETYEIPYQLEVLPFGGTDAYAIERARSGVPTAALSIPTRYIHTPSEICDLADADNALCLLEKLVKEEIEL